LSTATNPTRSPVLPVTFAALLLILGIGLLLLSFVQQSNASKNQQRAHQLADTVDQLSSIINTDNTDWVQSDQLAQLVVITDVQVSTLTESNDGIFAFLSPVAKIDAAREVSADWKQLREGLLVLNQASREQQSRIDLTETETTEPETPPEILVKTESAQTTVVLDTRTAEAKANSLKTPLPQEVVVLSQDYATLSSSVIQGTRMPAMLDLIAASSENWEQINNSQSEALPALIAQQQNYAEELLRLSGAGTQNSLFGYYISNQITDYAQRLKNIQLPDPQLQPQLPEQLQEQSQEPLQAEPDQAQTAEPLPAAAPAAASDTDPAPLSTAFVKEALLSLQQSVSRLLNVSTGESSSVFNWIGLAGLTVAMLVLLSALSNMFRSANALDEQFEASDELAVPEPDRSAISAVEADQLIEDINAVADGDLRYAVRVPAKGHAKVMADTINRSSFVIHDLVEMTRGVAARLQSLVQNQEHHSRNLAELDIRRQNQTAEMSDNISLRSGYLKRQRRLLSDSSELTKEIQTRSETATNGANQVSASIATISAQVEVGVERLQRLEKTAGLVTTAVGKLKEMTEKTRLQALNVSLKMPMLTRDTVSADDDYNNDEPADNISADYATGMFDDIHQLTSQLVQISNEADTLVSTLQRDIQDTALALKQSSTEMNESAHHTLSTSLLGKELAGYTGQLQDIVAETLQNVEVQLSELSLSAEQIVQHDKTGNDYSELTQSLSHDLAGLKEMSTRLEESVSGFKTRGEVPLE